MVAEDSSGSWLAGKTVQSKLLKKYNVTVPMAGRPRIQGLSSAKWFSFEMTPASVIIASKASDAPSQT